MVKQLGSVAGHISRASHVGSGKELQPARMRQSYRADNLPPAFVARTEIDLPRALVSAWTPLGGAKRLRRAMTPDERSLIVARVNELEDCLRPTEGADEADRVAVALLEMNGSFSALRTTNEEDAVARVASVAQLLSGFPTWAVEKACHRIRMEGVERDGKPCKRFPPNDSELVAMVDAEIGARKVALDAIRLLLTAEVEPPGALLPRAPVDPAPPRYTPPIGEGNDGKHAQRVAADIEKRKKKARAE